MRSERFKEKANFLPDEKVRMQQGHLERIGCGVSIHLSQQGEYPAHPDGLWSGSENSGASLRFDPGINELVFCVHDGSLRIVNLPLFYTDTDLDREGKVRGETRALVQIDHDRKVIERFDPNVNDEVIGQVAIDNALWSLFKVLLPSHEYRGNLIGLQ